MTLESTTTRSMAARPLTLAALAGVLLLSASACASPEQRVERYTKSGVEFLEKEDFGRANVQFQNALKINEEHVPALAGLAEIAEKRQDFGAMFGILQRIVRLEPQNADALVKMAQIYLIGDDETQALETAERVLAIDAKNDGAIAVKAAVLLKLDDAAGAVDLAREALAINPANAEATTILATERARAGDHEGALAQIEEGLNADAKSAVLQLLRLQVLALLGRTEEQGEGHRQLIAAEPDNVSYRQLYVSYLLDRDDVAGARAQLVEIVKLKPGDVDAITDVVRVDYRAGGAEAARKTFESFVAAEPKNADLKFAQAAFLRQEGDHAAAEAIYKAFAEQKSDPGLVARARNEIAALRVMQGKTEEARTIVESVIAADPQNTDALIKRASMRIDAGEYDAAIADLRTALTNKPDAWQAKILTGSAFEKKGDLQVAEGQMAQAFADSKRDPAAASIFAQFLIRNNKPPRAKEVLTQSLAAHPRSVENWKRLAGVQLMLQDWRGAEESAKKIAELAEDEPAAQRILGAAYAGLKDFDSAISALTEAQSKAPLAARPLATLVAAFIQDGRAAEAETMLSRMIADDAGNYAARIMLAQTQQAQQKTGDAEATLLEALRRAPERAEASESLYRLYRAADRDADAERMLDAQIAAAPAADGHRMLKADLLIATGRGEEAIEIYRGVLERRPNDLLAANNYASLLLETRADPQSRAEALKAARVLETEDNPFFLDTLGWALHLNGDSKAAASVLQRAAAIAPGAAEIQYHLGAALLAAGDGMRAREALEKAVAAGGEAPYVQKARDLLAQN